MYDMWDNNMYHQTNVHEYSAELQNENNNNIEYKTRPKTPEIYPENQIITSFDDLKITEWPGEIEIQEFINNSPSANPEEKDKEKDEKKKRAKKTKEVKELKKLRTVHEPICIHHIPLEPEELNSLAFAPVLKRKKKREGCFSPDGLVIDTNPEMDGYDSDETVNKYVECGEEGMCKCRRMRGRDYYEDYLLMECRDYIKFYSHGKREFSYGTVLHFTGAPEDLSREDLYIALLELGATIEFLDYQQGDPEGWIRLNYPYEARIVIKKMEDKKFRIGNAELIFNVLSGKEQKKYLKNVSKAIFTLQEVGKNRKMEKSGFRYS